MLACPVLVVASVEACEVLYRARGTVVVVLEVSGGVVVQVAVLCLSRPGA